MICPYCHQDNCTYQQIIPLKSFIAYYLWREGIAPTQREMQRAMGKSSGTIRALLDKLEESRHIRRLPNRVRAIEVIR